MPGMVFRFEIGQGRTAANAQGMEERFASAGIEIKPPHHVGSGEPGDGIFVPLPVRVGGVLAKEDERRAQASRFTKGAKAE